jgi:hypothetical protein
MTEKPMAGCAEEALDGGVEQVVALDTDVIWKELSRITGREIGVLQAIDQRTGQPVIVVRAQPRYQEVVLRSISANCDWFCKNGFWCYRPFPGGPALKTPWPCSPDTAGC